MRKQNGIVLAHPERLIAYCWKTNKKYVNNEICPCDKQTNHVLKVHIYN